MQKVISLLILILPLITAILTFILVVRSFKESKFKKISTSSLNMLEVGLRRNKSGYFSYSRLELYLKKMGVNAMFDTGVTPQMYVVVKIIMGLILGLVGVGEQNIVLFIVMFLLGFYLPDIFISISNKEDNDKILGDLQKVYDTLRIQSKAGVFLTNALSECYLVAKNRRLKKALLELTAEIIAKNNINSALQDFNDKFSNPYIDTFCIVISQSLESGKTSQVLEDLSAQLADIQAAMDLKEEEKTKSKMLIRQFAVFTGVLGIIAYGIFTELVSSLANF